MSTDAVKTLGDPSSYIPEIRIATLAERDRVVSLITLAFSSDPIVRWIYPDPHHFLSSFPGIVGAFGGNAFEQGSAYYAEGFAGAALWLPPGVNPDEEELVSVLTNTVPESGREAVFGVLEQMGKFHPHTPCWYLPLIGVDPSQQGKGYGSALLRHALEVCDRNHEIAYLESSNPRNIPLYQRHGFQQIGEIQASSSPTIVPMLREPK